MSKKLQFDNSSILQDCLEVGTLRSPSSSGSSVSIIIDNNDGLAQNDYVLFEEIGTGRAEIAQIDAAVSAGTTIRVDSLLFPHNVGVKVYRLAYNQVKFYHDDVATGLSKTLLGSAVDIDADDEFTEYIDSDNSTGYAFFSLYNSTTADESDPSSAFPYSLLNLTAKSKIREFVKKFYKKALDDETFSFLADSAEDEIFSIRLWRFREKTASFETVASQQAYSFDSISLSDYGTGIYASFEDIYRLNFLTIKEHQALNEGAHLGSAIPQGIYEFAKTFYLTPIPSSVGTVDILYYANASGFEEETSVTAMNMPQAIAFRVLQDLWSMDDEEKARYWERRYLQVVSVAKGKEREQVGRFAPITDSSITRRRTINQIDFPQITV